MLSTILLVLSLGSFATLVAYLVNNRRADSPSVPKSSLPVQIDRGDFEEPHGKWLLIFFSSDTCNSCNNVRSLINDLTVDSFHIQEIEFPKRKDLHQRYGINSVPIVLIANEEGVVIWSFAGVPPSDLISDVVSSL